jgi:hypothetical protein
MGCVCVRGERGEERRGEGERKGGATVVGMGYGGPGTVLPYLIMAFTVSDSHEVMSGALKSGRRRRRRSKRVSSVANDDTVQCMSVDAR